MSDDVLNACGDLPVDDNKPQIKKLAKPESISSALRNTNPHFGDPEYENNCPTCSTAAFLRMQGYDVHAAKSHGQMRSLEDLLTGVLGLDPAIHSDTRIIDDKNGFFAKSPADAERMLLRKFGKNAEGVIRIPTKLLNGQKRKYNENDEPIIEGHAFNFKIVDGVVKFFDTQDPSGIRDDSWLRSVIWNVIDPGESVSVYRLDGLEPIIERVLEEFE